MKMNHKEALHIIGVNFNDLPKSIDDCLDHIKQAYRKACSKYHPDRNPSGLEMMKLVNAAWEALEDVMSGHAFDSSVKHESAGTERYGDEINAALNAILGLGLEIEICGSWLWVGGDTRQHKEVLKQAGFKWAPKKALWHFRPAEYKSFSRGTCDMEKIRLKYGSAGVRARSYKSIEAGA